MTERTMPPIGEERDALVAELVFGWLKCDTCGDETCYWQEDYGYRKSLTACSTDNHAALDALMGIQRQGWDVSLTLVAIGMPGRYAGKSNVILRKEGMYGGEIADTLADAVSAAVIRAKWAEQDAKHDE